MTIQSYASARTNTTTCGQFVVFYIYQKSRGLTLEVILRKYFSTHNKLRNDLLGRDFVKFLSGAAIQFIYLRLCIITQRMLIIVYIYIYTEI